MIYARLRTKWCHMVLLGRHRTILRVAFFLIALAEKRRARGRPRLLIRLQMGREDIANYLGLTIETNSGAGRRRRHGPRGQWPIIGATGRGSVSQGK